MPKGPISSPPLQPKKAHGIVDDDVPIDDYENAVHECENENENVHILADEPNIAAARRANKPGPTNPNQEKGGTGSQNRSKSGH